MRWACSWAAGVGLGLLTQVAAAQTPGRVSLRWNAPDECPDDVQLVHQIEKLLVEPLPDRGDGLALSVRVVVQGSVSAGYAAKLSFEGAQVKDLRDLEHPSCDKLLSAVALVVALAIDPERVHANQAAAESAPAPPEANAPLVLNTPSPAPESKIEPDLPFSSTLRWRGSCEEQWDPRRRSRRLSAVPTSKHGRGRASASSRPTAWGCIKCRSPRRELERRRAEPLLRSPFFTSRAQLPSSSTTIGVEFAVLLAQKPTLRVPLAAMLSFQLSGVIA